MRVESRNAVAEMQPGNWLSAVDDSDFYWFIISL